MLRALIVVLSIAGWIGCSPKKGEHAATRTAQASVARESGRSAGLDAALLAWRSGNMEHAVQQLLDAKGDDLAAHSTLRVFQLSEEDVKHMSQEDRKSFQEELLQIAPQVKELGRHCLSLGEEALRRNDTRAARQYFEAVYRLGQTLVAPERVVVMHSIGKFLISASQDGLSRCEQQVR